MASALTSSRKSISVMKILSFVSLSLVILAFPLSVHAQTYSTRSHTVTVIVSTINNVTVSSAVVSLTISAAAVTAGQNVMGPVVNSATSVLWGFNSSLRKITVRTNLAAPLFTLKVLAVAPTQGTACPEVTLTTVAADFLINLGRSSGTATLQYTGTALATAGVGTDSHTVTYTITVQ